MKQTFYSAVIASLLWIVGGNAYAVAPLPGLDLVEPYRARAPFTIGFTESG